MTYVDNMHARYGNMYMSHMIADSTEELLQMANLIGINWKWIQQRGTPREHFDICQSKRKQAISFGAKEVTSRELVKIIKAKS